MSANCVSHSQVLEHVQHRYVKQITNYGSYRSTAVYNSKLAREILCILSRTNYRLHDEFRRVLF